MRTVALLWRSTHPGPTLVVTAVVLGLGISVGLPPARLAVLVISVLLGQVSIGLSNDALDARRDRASGRRDKPLALPGAPVRTAWAVAVAAAMLALALGAGLDWRLALAHAVFLGAGWAYNGGLKSTVWSAACFLVGFAVVPSLATLARPEPVPAPPWAWIAGAALGLAVHFSNVLPDLDDDAKTGVRGLPHRLGPRGSVGVAVAALALGAVATAFGPALGGAGGGSIPAGRLLGASLVVAVALLGAIIAARPSGRSRSRALFRLVMLAALLLAAQLVLTGGLVD